MLRLLEKIINKFLLFQYKYFEKNVSIGKGTSIRSGFYARTCGSGKIIICRNSVKNLLLTPQILGNCSKFLLV